MQRPESRLTLTQADVDALDRERLAGPVAPVMPRGVVPTPRLPLLPRGRGSAAAVAGC